MEIRIIDNDIRLIPYYRNDEVSLAWYQDLDVCKQVDNIDHTYDLETLHNMYDYLSSHGDCYYIEYQDRHIGRKCVTNMLKLAKEKGYDKVIASIYTFNEQSKSMFRALGFVQTGEEDFELIL